MKIEIRGQRSEVRSQRSEVRSQRSEVSGQKSESGVPPSLSLRRRIRLRRSVVRRPSSVVWHLASAFTLVELLVVISIIALLLGIIVPSYFSIREKAKYTKAKVTAKNLETAFKMYLDHYRVWPSVFMDDNTTLEIGDDTAGTPDEKIFRILQGENVGNDNKDSLTFYEFEGTNSAALDPWSNPSDPDTWKPYLVRVDKNYDNKIGDLYRTVIVWSVGTNADAAIPRRSYDSIGAPATKEGNVKSWD